MRRHAWYIYRSIDSEILVTREFYHGSQEILPLSRTLCGATVEYMVVLNHETCMVHL